MVPSIFVEMEKAENSDGFDSCDDQTEKEADSLTGNPFQDFNK